jgi:hypothetical protein
MRDDLNYLDKFDDQFCENPSDPDEPKDLEGTSSDHILLGAKQKACTFDALSKMFLDDVAFTNFRVRLVKFLNNTLAQEALPGGRRLMLEPHHNVRPSEPPYIHESLLCHQIQEFRYLKVNFESMVDWRQATDHLRCSPNFHDNVRQDFVIVKTGVGESIFAQLLFLFKCTIANNEYRLALILPFDKPVPTHEQRKKDIDLGLLRVRTQPRKQAEFIFVDSIIRGALLADSFDSEHGEDHLVIDTVDTDMFLRLRTQS